MRTFLNHIKNETLDEIKRSLENLWQQMIQLSEFFQYSFVLILERKCLVRASRVRSGESGTPSTIIYTRWSSRRYELGCDTPVLRTSFPGLGLRTTMASQKCLNTFRISINSSPYEQNGRHFADALFRCIFVNERFCTLIKISLKFVPKV